MVFLGAWIGHYRGVTGVAFGVLGALFLNYLIMAELSLSVGQISWSRFAQAQLPAVWLTMLVGAVTVAITEGTRHLGWPPLVGLIGGSLGAAITAVVAATVAPRLTLGEQGTRVRDTLRAYLVARIRPARAGGSA